MTPIFSRSWLMKIIVVLGVVERTGHLAQRLAHQPGLQADVAVAHLALDLGAGHERGHRVDDDQVERAGADQHVGDLERLLTGVGLGDQQRVGVDAERLGVVGVERVLGVDEGHDAAGAPGRWPPRAGRPSSCRRTPDRRSRRPGRAGRPPRPSATSSAMEPVGITSSGARDLVAQPHDRALAELLLDVGERGVERLLAVSTSHVLCPFSASGVRYVCDARASHRHRLISAVDVCGEPRPCVVPVDRN